jgi:hypothetical protein
MKLQVLGQRNYSRRLQYVGVIDQGINSQKKFSQHWLD